MSKTNDISMRSEVLDIGYSEVRVAYVFENESDHEEEESRATSKRETKETEESHRN